MYEFIFTIVPPPGAPSIIKFMARLKAIFKPRKLLSGRFYFELEFCWLLFYYIIFKNFYIKCQHFKMKSSLTAVKSARLCYL